MRIFYALLIMVVAVLLFLLPVTEAVYDFRTDVREETFNYATGVGVTSANVTLFKAIYNSDTSTIAISSNRSTDAPLFNTYAASSHSVNITGLTNNTSRALLVSYDVNALSSSGGIESLLNVTPFYWLLMIVAFPAAAIAAIWMGRV